MELKNIIFKADLINLTREDRKNIMKLSESTVPKGISDIDYLYERKDELLRDKRVGGIITGKVFAGQTSIKWYRLRLESIEELRSRIEKLGAYNQINTANLDAINAPVLSTCIKVKKDTYLLRYLMKVSDTKQRTGTDFVVIPNINNIICLMDLKKGYVEVRASSKTAAVIMTKIAEDLGLYPEERQSFRVLGNFGNRLEDFAHSLNKGKFIDVKSNPNINLSLDKEQKASIGRVLKALDSFFVDKDYRALYGVLEKESPNFEDTPFTWLLYSGMDRVAMSIKDSEPEDLSNQVLYEVSRDFLNNQAGYITFEYNGEHTILVGLHTDSIVFKTSATEEVIEYIRSKIL